MCVWGCVDLNVAHPRSSIIVVVRLHELHEPESGRLCNVLRALEKHSFPLRVMCDLKTAPGTIAVDDFGLESPGSFDPEALDRDASVLEEGIDDLFRYTENDPCCGNTGSAVAPVFDTRDLG